MKIDDPLTQRIIGCAIAIHRSLGPGLLESAYEECLALEFREGGFKYRRQVPLPIVYKSLRLEQAYRIDFIVDDAVVVEIKSVERILAVHEAQLLTYLRLSGTSVGLLINFGVATLRDGIRRMTLREAPESSSPPPRLPAKSSEHDA